MTTKFKEAYVPFPSRLVRCLHKALTSGFETSMHRICQRQTSVDTRVTIGGGAFVAAAVLGLVLIYGAPALVLVGVATPLAAVANRSAFHLRCTTVV
ncbi:hypothetical protein [Streptomyces sp. NPDC014733]|uniref:hypothetical protein n=1 Tax=Streptomyces sp. NPDC014733 TaxID=3364885 RepID=UPI0036F62ADA